MKEFFRRRVVEPIVTLLLQGVTPAKIALSLAFGIGLGIFPVVGTTMILCTLAAVAWRLNLIAIQAVHFAMTPLQLLLIIPFVHLGERVLHAKHEHLSVRASLDLLSSGSEQAMTVLRDALLHAVLGWLVVGPVVIYVLYRALAPLLEDLDRRLRRPDAGTS